MNRREVIEQYCTETEQNLLMADGFDEAVLGVVRKCNEYSVLYDYNRCVGILMTDNGMSEEEALEYMEFNVVDAFMGENTCSFLVERIVEEKDGA